MLDLLRNIPAMVLVVLEGCQLTGRMKIHSCTTETIRALLKLRARVSHHSYRRRQPLWISWPWSDLQSLSSMWGIFGEENWQCGIAVAQVFISLDHEKASHGVGTPGPTTSNRVSAFRSQTMSGKASAPSWGFGTGPRLSKYNTEGVPGPGAYCA